MKFYTTHCYACDQPSVGVRDRRPEGGFVEAACARHADHSIAAVAGCHICGAARPSLDVGGVLAHKSCHMEQSA